MTHRQHEQNTDDLGKSKETSTIAELLANMVVTGWAIR